MNDLDLDRLGDLWRAEPDPREMERLQRSAASAARRARWGEISDVALALFVSVIVLVLAWSNPTLRTGVVGGAAILLVLSSTARQRQLRKLELKALTGTSEEMLDQSIERVRATRKRTLLGLLGAIPAIGLGVALGAVLESDGSQLLARWRANENAAFLFAAGAVVAFAILYLYLANMVRRSRAELNHLLALRESYRREEEAGASRSPAEDAQPHRD